MALEANIVYLDEELKNNRERMELMAAYLKEHPSVSIYKRVIRGRVYYYKKYWKDGKSVSEFLCKDEAEYAARSKEIAQANQKRVQIKSQFKRLKQVNLALAKQLRIAQRAHQDASPTVH